MPECFKKRHLTPWALIVASVWLLVGCLYIPTGENVHLTGSKKDFRQLPAYDDHQNPQVAGRFTRDKIEALLGPPPYVSANRRRVMYVVHVKSGLFIAPLCFTARDRFDHGFALVLVYDSAGRLVKWEKFDTLSTEGQFGEPYGIDASFGMESGVEHALMLRANQKFGRATTYPAAPVDLPDRLKPDR